MKDMGIVRTVTGSVEIWIDNEISLILTKEQFFGFVTIANIVRDDKNTESVKWRSV